jgi:hypothetical protein
MMAAVNIAETSGNSYQTARHNIPEDSRRLNDNLWSHGTYWFGQIIPGNAEVKAISDSPNAAAERSAMLCIREA